MTKVVLLSFDLEEFDIPEEYGQLLEPAVKFAVSLKGLEALLPLLEQLQIRSTFFVTANFAKQHPHVVRSLAQTHEVASHGFYHDSFAVSDLRLSKDVLEGITHTAVTGFRMARLQAVSDRAIAAAGYVYNSSMNPTYLPGRYNNFWQKRTAFYSQQLLQIPVSVTPLIRFPLFWLSFKNLPLLVYKVASQLTLQCDRYLNLYFHPWEFIDITSFKLPGYVKRHSGNVMLLRLERYLTWLLPQAEFITFSEFKLVHAMGQL
ncbi:polysaccharide deacetylase family protein [Stenomitos frigidus]|uniref:Polysaccharide deacetylase n=1 Tax=Stenomitos frigidus ULC18 TaxID=2107698 RepID=A0A2T1EIE6_9CYAN|nr:polysaccharide deacetylase family protein [Stenomitos frigidus]PSB32455.1 polysaccharide deacetylase [Stenomitos frigidus ULC18]